MTITDLRATNFNSAPERAEYYRKLTQHYTMDGFSRLRRHWEYLHKGTDMPPYSIAITLIVGGILVGGSYGKKIGQGIGKAVFLNSNGEKLGGDIGLSVGMVGGGLGGVWSYMKLIEQTKQFVEWKLCSIERSVKEAITGNYGDDVVLKNFNCPISQCVMLSPALSPTNTAYDYETLLNLAREDDGRIKDPYRNESFEEDAIRSHSEMGIVTTKRTLFLMKEDLSSFDKPSDIVLKETLQKNIASIEVSIQRFYEEAKDKIENLRREEKVSVQEYVKMLTDFFELFGVKALENLDWSKEWPTIIDNRLKQFNKLNG